MPDKSYKRRQFIGTVTSGILGPHLAPQVLAQDRKQADDTALKIQTSIDIVFAGTGAADWPAEYPEPGTPLEKGGYRGNASIILDSKILIDCGPTVPGAFAYHGFAAQAITDIFLTHSHGDHVKADALMQFSTMAVSATGIGIHGDPYVLERATPPDSFVISPLSPMDTVEKGDMRLTALPANHVVADSQETPLHYLIEKGDTRVLYATDGAWLLKPVWLYLRERPLDAVIWDATIGEVTGDWRIFEHNSLDMIRLMDSTLKEQHVLKPDARTVLTHMARTLWAPHQEVTERLSAEEIIPAYDGMRMSV